MTKRYLEAECPWEAWTEASALLLGAPGHRARNLIVRIRDASEVDPRHARLLDHELASVPSATVRAVARTIMPAAVLSSPDWRGAAQLMASKLPTRSYLRRMIDFSGDGRVNQIERVISAFQRDRAYADPIPIIFDRPDHTAAAHIGFPCLSQIQFHREGALLIAAATYRSHHYHSKAYGNFVGLGRLQRLIARETLLDAGELLIVSTDAVLQKVRKIRQILEATRCIT